MARQFSLVEGPTVLYDVLANAKKIGAKSLLLDGNDENSARKIQLFRFGIRDESNRTHYISVSYVLKGEHNDAFYAFDSQEYNAARQGVQDQSIHDLGVTHPQAYLLRFMRLNNNATGRLAEIRKKSRADLESMNYQFYTDILSGKDYVIHHAGNDETRKWKYALSEEEEKEVLEAFAFLFRKPLTGEQEKAFKDQCEYGIMLRNELSKKAQVSRNDYTPSTGDEGPSF